MVLRYPRSLELYTSFLSFRLRLKSYTYYDKDKDIVEIDNVSHFKEIREGRNSSGLDNDTTS